MLLEENLMMIQRVQFFLFLSKEKEKKKSIFKSLRHLSQDEAFLSL